MNDFEPVRMMKNLGSHRTAEYVHPELLVPSKSFKKGRTIVHVRNGFGSRKSRNAPNNKIQGANITKIRDDIIIHGVDGERNVQHAE